MKESQHQEIIVQHLEARCAKDATWLAVPNGMPSNPISVRHMKRQGLRPGAPDMLFLKRGHLYAIELKAEHTGKASPVTKAQARMSREIHNAGGTTAVCFGHEEAIERLEKWGVLVGQS